LLDNLGYVIALCLARLEVRWRGERRCQSDPVAARLVETAVEKIWI
jgi:hypothetical protein